MGPHPSHSGPVGETLLIISVPSPTKHGEWSPHVNHPVAQPVLTALLLLGLGASPTQAQATGQASAQAGTQHSAEVIQVVTFRFQPGKSSEAIRIFRELALPLYERNPAMLSFRGLREIESPEPLDLVVLSTFNGMAGMDASNEGLRAAAEEAGTTMGAFYGAIGEVMDSHHDQFVELLSAMTNGDPTTKPRVALVSYQLSPGAGRAFEAALERTILPWERSHGVPTTTGRFLISDGWHYLRIIGLDSLGDFQDYWARLTSEADYAVIDRLTARRKELVLAPVPELAVR